MTDVVRQLAFGALIGLALYLLWSAAAVIVLAFRWPDRVQSMQVLVLIGSAMAGLVTLILLAPVVLG